MYLILNLKDILSGIKVISTEEDRQGRAGKYVQQSHSFNHPLAPRTLHCEKLPVPQSHRWP